MDRHDLENLLLSTLVNPSTSISQLLTDTSSSSTNLSSLSRVDTSALESSSSTSIANWSAYERKMANIFDKPRADACPCQCHKVQWRSVTTSDQQHHK
jgi:hypothetical protein